jgi:hypothetical protein
MTVEDIANSLPNGFHDSLLESFHADYVKRTLSICLQIDLSVEAEAGNRYRRAELELTGLIYVSVEPPDPRYLADTNKLVIDMGDFSEVDAPKPAVAMDLIPEGVSACWTFVDGWNSFIQFAAAEAHLTWRD